MNDCGSCLTCEHLTCYVKSANKCLNWIEHERHGVCLLTFFECLNKSNEDSKRLFIRINTSGKLFCRCCLLLNATQSMLVIMRLSCSVKPRFLTLTHLMFSISLMLSRPCRESPNLIVFNLFTKGYSSHNISLRQETIKLTVDELNGWP